jgi:hypothetical protein
MTSEEVGSMRFHFLEIRMYLTTYKHYNNYNSSVIIRNSLFLLCMNGGNETYCNKFLLIVHV